MNKDRFLHHCLEAEAGRDAFVAHSPSGTDGMVTECILQSGHFVVHTTDNETRCWDYRECEDLPISRLTR